MIVGCVEECFVVTSALKTGLDPFFVGGPCRKKNRSCASRKRLKTCVNFKEDCHKYVQKEANRKVNLGDQLREDCVNNLCCSKWQTAEGFFLMIQRKKQKVH